MIKLDVLTGSSTSTTSHYLVSLAEVCTPLGIATSASTIGFVNSAIGYVSAEFESYCQRKLKAVDLLGSYDGDGSCWLNTQNYPINSITTLKYRTAPNSAYTNIITNASDSISANVVIYTTGIELYNYRFPVGSQSIQIYYNAGYSTIPDDLKMIAIEAVIDKIKQFNVVDGEQRLGISTKNTQGGTETYVSIAPQHKLILDRYKKRLI